MPSGKSMQERHVPSEGRIPSEEPRQEGHMAEEDALDGVTSDGHSVMSDGTLAAAENPAGASRKKSPSRAKELGARILVFTV